MTPACTGAQDKLLILVLLVLVLYCGSTRRFFFSQHVFRFPVYFAGSLITLAMF